MSRSCAILLSVLLVAPLAAPAETTSLEDALSAVLPPPVAGLGADDMAAFRGHMQAYWNPPREAAGVAVTVGFALTPEGIVQDGEVRLLAHTDAPEAAVEQAFQAARRAVLRALAQGYDLPAEHYALWRDVELTFDPDGGQTR